MNSASKRYWLALTAAALILGAPTGAISKNAEASKAGERERKPAQIQSTPDQEKSVPLQEAAKQEPLKVASVGTTGFGFSEAASDLKLTVDQVLEIVTDATLQKDGRSRKLALRQVIDKRFDFKQMAMHTLDNVWENRSIKERRQFTNLFRKLLEKSYMGMIENFQGGKVHFLSERVKGDYAFIKTNIVSPDRTIAVHYKLKREGKEWRVYDFLVQGVSMVRNYRFQFSKVIQQESFKGLLKRLREQTA